MGLLLFPFQNKMTRLRFDTVRLRHRAFATAAIRHRWRTQKSGERVCCEDALAKHYSPDTLEWKRSWWKTHNNGRTAAQRKYIHSIDEMNLRFSHHSGPISRSGLNPVQLLTLDLNKDNYGNRFYDTMKVGPNILRPALTIPSVGRTDGRSAGRTVNRSDGRSRADGLIF